MNCPSCGGVLAKGKLKFSDKLKWVPDGEQTFLQALFNEDSIVLSDTSLARFQSREAYACTTCKMIVIMYE